MTISDLALVFLDFILGCNPHICLSISEQDPETKRLSSFSDLVVLDIPILKRFTYLFQHK